MLKNLSRNEQISIISIIVIFIVLSITSLWLYLHFANKKMKLKNTKVKPKGWLPIIIFHIILISFLLISLVLNITNLS